MTTQPDLTPCYIGREQPCGCAVAVVVDTPDHLNDTAKEIGRMVRQGLTIEHTTVEVARAQLHSCPHRVKKAKTS